MQNVKQNSTSGATRLKVEFKTPFPTFKIQIYFNLFVIVVVNAGSASLNPIKGSKVVYGVKGRLWGQRSIKGCRFFTMLKVLKGKSIL